ncbi:MAG: bifunctional DNA-formamidopyrimidine glycosylase/DNA-(apurinic or apyrimidinic site) lyase [Sphingomonadales bacterium]
MPELPEVETVCRGLAGALTGKRLTRVLQRRPDMRFPFPEGLSQMMTGQRVKHVRRRAKYGLIDLSNDQTVIFHLGMSGRMRIEAKQDEESLGKHDHLYVACEDGISVAFNDPRRFGFVDLSATDALSENRFLRDLGPDPLDDAFSSASLSEALAGKATPIKSALLDQRVVAGLGNIYVCEALFESGISPKRLARSVPGRRAERLVPAIKSVLARAIKRGGSTLRDYVHVDGQLGYFQHDFQVYGREGELCKTPGCGHLVKRIVQSGRSTFFCSHCQR